MPFETSFVADIQSQLVIPQPLYQQLFFPNTEDRIALFHTEKVIVKLLYRARQAARYVAADQEAEISERGKYEKRTFDTPYIKEKRLTQAGEYLKEGFIDSEFSTKTPLKKASDMLAQDMLELASLLTLVKELQAKALLGNGSMTLTGKKVNITIDYGMPAANKITLTGADRWSESTSKPLEDLRNVRKIISRASGLNPSIAIFGSSAWDNFSGHADIKERLKIIQTTAKPIKFDHVIMPDGAIYQGYVEGYHCFTYYDKYVDEAGSDQDLMDEHDVFFGSTKAETKTYYGCIQDKKALTPMDVFFKTWEIEDPSADVLLMQSAPLLGMTQANGFGKLLTYS